MPSVITFLSDYGLRDEFVGVVHGVIARMAPAVRVIDLTHGIPPQDVRAGGLALARALPFTPAGIHLAVVDPGVGGERRAVALLTRHGDRVLVGPDNGLLSLAAKACGGAAAAVEISHSPWRLEPVSATFHGRDVFAPVAARLALGADLTDAGTEVDPAGLVPLDLPEPVPGTGGGVLFDVLAEDVFGNLQLALGGLAVAGLAVGGRAEVLAGNRRDRAHCGRTFSDVSRGELLLHEDAGGMLALAVNGGSAAARFGVSPGERILVRPV